jgi:hypothetical protein
MVGWIARRLGGIHSFKGVPASWGEDSTKRTSAQLDVSASEHDRSSREGDVLR